jgi:protein translocase SecG subunit
LIVLAAAAAAAASAAPAASAKPQIQVTMLPQSALQAAQTQAPLMPQTWFQLHASWLTHGVAGLFIVSAVSLIVLLALQTTKQEGLSGTIGGRVESAYRGRLGAEEQLKRATSFSAIVFVFTAFLLSLTGI